MSQLSYLRDATDYVAFAKGEVIFREGDSGDVMYVVLDGEVDIVVGRRVMAILSPGALLGEMSMVDHEPRSATAVAKTDCRLLPINEKRFLFLVKQTPFFALQVMRVMAARLRNMNSHAAQSLRLW